MDSCKVTQCVKAWKNILSNDQDKNYILDGIENGFYIVDQTENVRDVSGRNYRSILQSSVKHIAEAQILSELENQNNVICKDKPVIVSSLGAIIKDNGKVRLIHDCSQLAGLGVNTYASTNKPFQISDCRQMQLAFFQRMVLWQK